MLDQLRNPVSLFFLPLIIGLVWNFVMVSREAAVQLSLRRNGIAGEARIVRKRRGGSRWPAFFVTYEFVEFATGKEYQRQELVYYAHYEHWRIGESVDLNVLPHNPRISRLTKDRSRPITLFGGGAISLIFPIALIGINSLLAIFVMCAVIFWANLLWINLRRK